VAADCALQDGNALRFDCAATTDPALEVTFRWTADDEPIREVVSPAGRSHGATLTGLRSGVEYAWEARATSPEGWDVRAGLLTTGALPEALAAIGLEVSDCLGCGDEAVLTGFGCGADQLFAVDRAGEVVWYEGLGAASSVGSVEVTDDGTVLALLDRSRIVEFGLDGEVLLDLVRGQTPGFDRYVHHDILRDGDATLAITAHDWTDGDGHTWVIDGVDTFEDGERTGRWALLSDGAFPPGPDSDQHTAYWNGLLEGQDWTHANAIDRAADGTLLFSLTAVHTVLGLEGDQLAWVLDGAEGGDFALESSVAGPAGFQGQHHVRATGAGLSLYDNRNPHDGCSAAGTCEDARFIELELDGAAATVVTERSFGRSCPTQGSVTELASGNLLISCAETGSVVELDPTGNVAWELELSCASGGGGPLYRALPLDL